MGFLLGLRQVLAFVLHLLVSFAQWLLKTWIPLWIAALVGLVLVWFTFAQMGAKAAAQREAMKLQADLELVETDLATCRDNTAKLEDAAAETKASLLAVEDESKRRLKEADKALQKALRGRKEAERLALELAAPVAGADTCTRMQAVDEKLLRSLR